MKSNRMCWTCGTPQAQSVEATPSGAVYVCTVCGTTRLVSSVEDPPHSEVPPPHAPESVKPSTTTPSESREDQAE